MDPGSAGSAYLVVPEAGPGPGVLLLHSWWGLTAGVRAMADSLADAGFTALVPDLCGGARPTDAGEAARLLGASDADATAALVLSSIVALRAHSADPDAGVGIVGFSMGGSWALWAATRQPASVRAAVVYYGHTDLDFAELEAPLLFHFAGRDPLVSADETAGMQANLLLDDKSIEVHHHDDTRHFFAESSVDLLDADGDAAPRTPAEEAEAEAAWVRTLAFLHEHLDGSP